MEVARPGEPRSHRSTFLLPAAVLAGFLIVPASILGLAEYAARRCFLPAIGSVMESDPYKRIILKQAPRGIVTPTTLSTNRWGMRGDEPPRDWEDWNTLFAVGSSTTLCYHLDDAKTWPYLLQQR